MSKELPWMRVYVKDFLASQAVAAMSLEEIGAYWLLLLNCWAKGGCLPSDEKQLANMSRLGRGWKKSSAVLLSCFPEHPDKDKKGFRTNLRLLTVWKESQEEYAKKADGGRKSGESRRRKREDTSKSLHVVFDKNGPKNEDTSNTKTQDTSNNTDYIRSPTENAPLTPQGEGGLFDALGQGWHEEPDPVGDEMERLRARWETCQGVAPRSLPVIPFKLQRPLRQCIQEPGWLDAANRVLDMVRDGPVPLVGGKTIPLTINKFATDSGWVRAFADGSHKNLGPSSTAKSFPGDTYDPNDKSGF